MTALIAINRDGNRLHFQREVALVDAQVEIADELDHGFKELAYRLLGNAHEDVVTGLEATLKTVYLFGKRTGAPSDPNPKVGNDFQNIERGQRRFAEIGFDPYDALDDEELALVALNIQKRHVIGHNLGIADARFAEHASDARVGETVHIVGDDIRGFAALALKVVTALDDWLAGQPLPRRERPVRATKETAEVSKDDRAARDLGLTSLAYRLGAWLACKSETGLPVPADMDAVATEFDGVEEADMREAVAELEADGYVKTWRSIGRRGVPPVVPQQQLFLTFDPLTSDHDPTLDAVELAATMREKEESVSTEELHAATGWAIRRFNPALGRALRAIDDRHVSKTLDARYPTRHFFITADDRVSLRRFVEQHQARRS